MYKTDNLALAAFLDANGNKVADIVGDHKVTFIFKGSENIKDMVKSFYVGGQVSAIDYWNSIKKLKNFIYERK